MINKANYILVIAMLYGVTRAIDLTPFSTVTEVTN